MYQSVHEERQSKPTYISKKEQQRIDLLEKTKGLVKHNHEQVYKDLERGEPIMEDQETRSISKESINYQDWYNRLNPNTDDGEEMAEIHVPQHEYQYHGRQIQE